MFTGIILAVGKITAIQTNAKDCSLRVDTNELSLADAALGDSIAVNGVCLTAVELGKQFFRADVSNETLSRTTLAHASVGMAVNVELALTPSTRMGGHIVSGHVDGIASVISKQADGRSVRFQFQVPDKLAKYIAEKGSICIDGISLTVNEVNGAVFGVNIVPHTLKKTTLNDAVIGTPVNIEVDILARYVERLMKGDAAATCSNSSGSVVTEELLARSGFIK